MVKAYPIILLLSLWPVAVSAAISFHSMAPKTQSEAIQHRVDDKTVVSFSKQPFIGNNDIKGVEVTDTATVVKLTQEGDKKLLSYTRANVGKRLALMINGKIVSAPVIRVPGFGDQIVIFGSREKLWGAGGEVD